jgi:ABC-type Na+ efflux pump permease subunit
MACDTRKGAATGGHPVTIMTVLIIIFGVLVLLAGLIILVNPETIFGLFTRHMEKPWLHVAAVLVRLILGVLLIVQSGISRFPLVIEVIGWISIAAALFFAVIGRNNFKRIISWALSLQHTYGRAGGVLAVGFGAFLVYSFV